MNRINIFTICTFLVLCGCTAPAASNIEEQKADTVESASVSAPEETTTLVPVETQLDIWNDDRVMKAVVIADLVYDNQNPSSMAENSNAAALIRIISVDGTDSYYENLDRYGSIYTYGKFEVINAYKGNLTAGQQYTFTRYGGVGTWDQYKLGRVPEALEKQEELMKENNETPPEYVYEGALDDIFVESGKTYLAYFETVDSAPKNGAYPITGLQGGLREADEANGRIKNNFTGEWESLEEIISTIH